MRCEEIMKREPACISPSVSAGEAARRMRNDNIGFLPVCEADKRVLGTLTDRDIAIRLVAENKSADTPVEEIMTREVIAARPSDDILQAEQLMAKHHKSRMLCIDEQERLVGVISLSDIAHHESGTRSADTLREITTREVRA